LNKPQKAKNYFVSFADPDKQAKYKDIADIGAGYKQLLGIINGYVNAHLKEAQKQNQPQQQKPKDRPNL
jgi:hypothetical protein